MLYTLPLEPWGFHRGEQAQGKGLEVKLFLGGLCKFPRLIKNKQWIKISMNINLTWEGVFPHSFQENKIHIFAESIQVLGNLCSSVSTVKSALAFTMQSLDLHSQI